MGFTLDTTPAKIEDTFTEMRDNFTAYNGRDGDQLEQDILNYTDEIISKAPKILTLTQRSEYLDNLNTSLTEIKRYYDNDACTFEVQIKSYTNQNSLCVGADDVATLVEDAQITENCDNL